MNKHLSQNLGYSQFILYVFKYFFKTNLYMFYFFFEQLFLKK